MFLSKIKPVPRLIIIAATVGALGYGLNAGLNAYNAANPPAVKEEVIVQEAPEVQETPLEKASAAVKKAINAPVQVEEPVRELDATETRGMQFLLKEGK